MNPLFISILVTVATVTIGVPIFYSLGTFVLVYFWLTDHTMLVMVQSLISGMNLFSLLALPLFLLAGQIMNRARITDDLMEFAYLIVGRLRGGLAHVNIVTSIVFAGISGAAVADASALGTTLIPNMEKKGYDRGFSVAVTAASSTIGPIIPPSIIMVLVGITSRQSIGALFLAGVVPGLLMGLGMMLLVFFFSILRDYPVVSQQRRPREIWRIIYVALPALLVPIVVIGGIVLGVFTPTEAAAVAVVYCLLYSVVRRSITIRDLRDSLFAAGQTSATILWIIGAARGISWILARNRVGDLVYQFIVGIDPSPALFLLIVNLLLLLVGMVLETSAALFIFIPILMPLAALIGIDALHMAFIVGMNLTLGLATPPLGLSLYVSANVGGLSLAKASRAVIPFVAVNVVVLLIASYIPGVVMWLPRLVGLIG